MSRCEIDVAFVILHYMVDDETVKCVEAIYANIDTQRYQIVIVDNNSCNGSFERLQDKYASNEKITLIHNNENLGFARGNNKGIDYICMVFEAKYICCLNNDVYLIERNLVSKLDAEYKNKPFAVAGPLILSGDGRYDSNPQKIGLLNTEEDVLNSIKRCERILFFLKFRVYSIYLLARRLKAFFKTDNSGKYLPNKERDVQLSGACIFFSSDFFLKNDGFCKETFLYKEEDILRFLLKKQNLSSVFMPEIVVYHSEDASTDATIKSSRKKMLFIYTEYIKSLNVLLEIMKNNRG